MAFFLQNENLKRSFHFWDIQVFVIFRWGTYLDMSLFPFLCPSVCPSGVPDISGTIHHLIIIFGTRVKWWYLQVFFSFFWFFWLVGGKRAKKPKMKNKNCMCHVPYITNSVAYDHDFWYTCVKWWYLQVFFSF